MKSSLLSSPKTEHERHNLLKQDPQHCRTMTYHLHKPIVLTPQQQHLNRHPPPTVLASQTMYHEQHLKRRPFQHLHIVPVTSQHQLLRTPCTLLSKPCINSRHFGIPLSTLHRSRLLILHQITTPLPTTYTQRPRFYTRPRR